MHPIYSAATKFEMDAYPPGVRKSPEGYSCEWLTGVGVPQVFVSFMRVSAFWEVEQIVNVGIAGAYPNSGLKIGDIVIADSEVYGDVGFELPDAPGFRSIVASDFGDAYREPISLKVPDGLERVNLPYRIGRGVTVSTCTGTRETGERREKLTGGLFETMEGAAVAQCGKGMGAEVIEIRCISNFASDRDMKPENIRLALEHLREFLAQWLRD